MLLLRNQRFLLLLLAAGCALAQTPITTVNLATQGRNVDFANFPFTRPVSVGASLPSTCQIGQLFFNTTAAPGANLYGCTSTNTWTALASSSNTAVPQVSLNPASLSFGTQTVGTTSAAKTVTLTNSGVSFLSVSAISLTGTNASDFLVSNNCGTTVPSGASCTITVTFQPSTTALETAAVSISGNEPGSPVLISLTGSGTAAITSGGLVITPSASYAAENGSVTLTANRPVNWAMISGSAGTLTANSSTSATYSAPGTIAAQNAIGGCPTSPNDSVFNTRIDSLPVLSASSTWTSNLGTAGLNFLSSWGTNIADATTPVKSMIFFYTPAYNGPFVMPQWPVLKREGGEFGTRLNGTDHHIMTVRKDNCQFYETYNDWFTPGLCRDGVTQGCNAQSGFTYAWNNYALPTQGSTDAAGLPLAPLMLHLDEIKAGAIHHGMRFTVSGGLINNSPVWPANGSNGGCAGCAQFPVYGTRFRLKASYNISSFSPAAQVVLTALKQYGMFLADAGTGPTVTMNTDVTEDPTVMAALAQIAAAAINMTNFEAVDESSLMVSNTSWRVNPANGYVTPAQFAAVQATDQTNSSYQVTLPIPLRSVNVGLPSPTLAIAAGVPGYQLTSWVNGTSNQSVTWSLVSGVGTVTAGGLYTPPATVSAASQAVLQATSAADANASATLYVTVLPVGTSPAGSIRIDSGNPTSSTDGGNNLGLGDQAFEAGDVVQLPSDYPNWPSLSGNIERSMYQSAMHTYGSDIVYRMIVPNGNYKIRIMFGQLYNGCSGASCTSFDPTWHAPLLLEANGQIAAHNFDFGLPINHQYATPTDAYIPATVTDNTLYIALRINLPDVVTSAQPSPNINGLEIIPDSSAAHLAIDTQQQTSVAAGSTLQLYAIGWYMSNAVTWSVSGPGSISATGLYTAPLNAGSSPQNVTITATSTANPSIQATATLTIPASGS